MNYCIEENCRKEISKKAKRCVSCENKRKHKLGILNISGKNNPNYGKDLSGKNNPNFGNHKLAGKNHWNYKGGKPKCEVCGKSLSRSDAKRCNKHVDKNGKNNPNFKHGFSTKRKCKDCGTIIKRYKAKRCRICENKTQRRKEKMSKRFSDKNNPMYIDGRAYEERPKEFYLIRSKIRKRDNHTCQLCFKYGKCVHHIDYNKKNCEEENLITLCRSCHSKTNSNRNYWQNFFQNKLQEVNV